MKHERSQKILSVVGARPQFIKAAVVSRAVRARGLHEFLLHTGQHYDDAMSARFFEELDIPPPDLNLGIGSGPHGWQTGRMLEDIERALLDVRPDLLLVYGDTNSTLAGALAAAKLHVPVAHVEAGLRSFDRKMPEEINRILTDHVSRWLFAPTEVAAAHLRHEGLASARIHTVGDVMYDAALHFAALADERSDVLQRLGLEPRSFLLATIHRAENTDDPNRLGALLEALMDTELRVVLPLHPRTRRVLGEQGLLERAAAKLLLLEPLGYLDMTQLTRNAALVATDSGGLQKEAFFHRVPCVTLRDSTEWTELVECGWNRLVPPDSATAVLAALAAAIEGPLPAEPAAAFFGSGDASARIAAVLAEPAV